MFVILETHRLLQCAERSARPYHWCSAHGAEVDLVIEEEGELIAVEIKSSRQVRQADLRGLKSFLKDYPQAKPLCISTCERPYLAGNIPILPWKEFFEELDLSS